MNPLIDAVLFHPMGEVADGGLVALGDPRFGRAHPSGASQWLALLLTGSQRTSEALAAR